MLWFNKEQPKTEQQESVENLRREKEELEKQVTSLKEEVADLKLKKKMEDEDIKHMVKMKEERLALDHERKVMEEAKRADNEIARVKDAYRDKMEDHLNKQVAATKDMYSQILKRLPDVNVRLKGNV